MTARSLDAQPPLKVAVIDMQPITPAIGGGRLRLLGLYHNLGPNIQTTYVGTYDWPGESYRYLRLSPTLEEVNVPLSDEHHTAARELSARASNKTVVDIAFHRQCHLSPDYLEAARSAISSADIVIFSHPWVFPPMQRYLRPGQTVVYDSQNVEGLLRAQLLDETQPVEADLLRGVVEAENAVGSGADLIFACSQDDLDLFQRIYGWPWERMRVIPNGAMAEAIMPATPAERETAREALGIPANEWLGIFVGSDYPPNLEAARFLVDQLAPALPEAKFVIAGGVGVRLKSAAPNVIVTGALDDPTKLAWLKACNFALNPMFSGSGTNIKMFDFMAAGLPVVTTPVGARGIATADREPFLITDPDRDAVVGAVRRLKADRLLYERTSLDARACVTEGYAWERLSSQTGLLLRNMHRAIQVRRPKFSVVVPSYHRHEQLDDLMRCLDAQIERDFEVVVIDQSPNVWQGRDGEYGFTLLYYHTPIRGAARARNTGAFLACGEIIAFTDDDCRPLPDWLAKARPYFSRGQVVGIEGLIESDNLDDPNFRPVANVGFEGVGFMTANLLVRAAAFIAVGGFDLAFDRPHFREDTDLGWRLQEHGEVPYARDVRAFHPAQPRAIERESALTRARFFEKDALLYAKHPARYRRLFELEAHWKCTPGFWENFRRGADKYAVDLSEFDSYMESAQSRGGEPSWATESTGPGRVQLNAPSASNTDLTEPVIDVRLARALCAVGDKHNDLRAALAHVEVELADAMSRVDAIAAASILGTHADYFRSSRARYAHYAALAKLHLPAQAAVLDVGNAPGHFAFLLTQMGYRVTGVNLNAEWRKTYPDPSWLELFHVTECDIEREALPFPDDSFDAVIFTEVLEHIAITDPVVVLARLRRVLRREGVLIFSTPNVCNLSNVIALLLGANIFWPREIFYGSLDRHNREWTPGEVREVFHAAGFRAREFYGMSDYSNWRGGGAADQVYALLGQLPREHALLLNTIVGVFSATLAGVSS